MDCLRIEVNLESRYGTYNFSSFFVLGLAFSERMLMTCRKVKRDLLISMLYFANLPYVPVIDRR